MNWGIIGDEHRLKTLAAPTAENRKGVERTIRDGADYSAPPLGENNYVWLECDRQTYEMVWEGRGSPASFRACCDKLRQNRDRLRRERKRNPHAELLPELVALDRASLRLCEMGGRLHAAGCGLGMLTPDNILVLAGDEQDDVKLILPDVGFIPIADSVVRTDWFERLTGQFENFWPKLTAEQVLARGYCRRSPTEWNRLDDADSPSKAKAERFDGLPDVRAVARIFATALVGRPVSSMSARPDPKEFGDPVWKAVLGPAMNGAVPDFKTLQALLSTHPLSEYFVGAPRRAIDPGPRSKVPWVLLLFVVTVMALSAGVAAFKPELINQAESWIRFKIQTAPVRVDCSGATPLPVLAENDPLKSLMEQFRSGSPDQKSVLNKILGHSSPSPDQQVWQQQAAREFIQSSEQELRDCTAAMQDPAQLVASLRQLRELSVSLAAVAKTSLVSQCQPLLQQVESCRKSIDTLLASYR